MESFIKDCGCSRGYADKIKEFAVTNPKTKAHFNNTILQGSNRLRLPITSIPTVNEEMIVRAKPYSNHPRLNDITISFLSNYNWVHGDISKNPAPDIFRAVLESDIMEAIGCLAAHLPKEEITKIEEKISERTSTKMTRIMSYGFSLAGCENYYNYFTSLIDLQKVPLADKYELLLTTEFTDLLWCGNISSTSTCLASEGSCRLYAPILAGLPNLGAVFVVPKGEEPRNAICRALMWLDDNDKVFLGQTQPKRYFFLEEAIHTTFVENNIWNAPYLFKAWQIQAEGTTIKRILRMLDSPLDAGPNNSPTFNNIALPYVPCDVCASEAPIAEIHLSKNTATCIHCLERKEKCA